MEKSFSSPAYSDCFVSSWAKLELSLLRSTGQLKSLKIASRYTGESVNTQDKVKSTNYQPEFRA